MRVGLVCPYTWDVPGGVQAHVRDLAEHLLELGHEVQVLAPVDEPDDAGLEPYVVPAGRAVPVPYNGSVARLAFGPLSMARTRRWLRAGRFDVLHLHEPTVPSVSMLALWSARGPMVATFHTSTPRSRALQVFGTVLQPGMEKLTGRIAVSPAARRVIMEHLGGDAVLVPNGVSVARFAGAAPLLGRDPDEPTVVFLGRIDEAPQGPRGPVRGAARARPAGPGRPAARRRPGRRRRRARLGAAPACATGSSCSGWSASRTRRGCTPAAPSTARPTPTASPSASCCSRRWRPGRPVVASDLEAFRRVLEDGAQRSAVPGPRRRGAGRRAGRPARRRPDRRAVLAERGRAAVQAYDWSTVAARQVVDLYETVAAAAPVALDHVEVGDEDTADHDPADPDDADPGGLRRLLAQLTGRGGA